MFRNVFPKLFLLGSIISCPMGLEAEVRDFTNKDGRAIRAEIVSVKGDSVELELSRNKKVYSVSIGDLIESDQEYIEQWAQSQHPYGWVKVKVSAEGDYSQMKISRLGDQYFTLSPEGREFYIPLSSYIDVQFDMGAGGVAVHADSAHFHFESEGGRVFVTEANSRGRRQISSRAFSAKEELSVSKEDVQHTMEVAENGDMIRLGKVDSHFTTRDFKAKGLHLEITSEGVDWRKIWKGGKRLKVTSRGDITKLDLGGIGYLDSLEELELHFDVLVNLSELKQLENLRSLTLIGSFSQEQLEELGDMKKLEHLSITQQNEVFANRSAYDFLSLLIGLHSLTLKTSTASFPDVTVFEPLKQLSFLAVEGINSVKKRELFTSFPHADWIRKY